MAQYLLEMKNIVKEFPGGVRALDKVNIQVEEKSIHALVGENGAGKSTLMNVLSGIYPYGTYSGDILYEGKECRFGTIRDSEKEGIVIIHQELALIPYLSIMENIFLGNEQQSHGIVNWEKCRLEAMKLMERVGLHELPDTPVNKLGVGKQQLIEIAKALSKHVKLLILDEPTSALNEDDSQNLLDLLRELKNQGVTCILISHKLKEVIEIADTVTVLRDGQTICTLSAHNGAVTENVLIKHMVGREIDNIYPRRDHQRSAEVMLEVQHWNAYNPKLGRSVLQDVNFNVKKGEIVGFAGLMGSGRTELALSIFGNPEGYKISGQMFIKGKKKFFRHPQNAIKSGLAYVTEDRKGSGLILIQDVKQNLTLANLRAISPRGIVNDNAEVKVANEYKTSLNIKTPTVEQRVANLSGGNQQKVSLGKWLFVGPDILILDEPTRGIDVGAKYEIYTIMNRLVQQGMSIIMISSELPEVLGMSDRVYVVSAGKITGELPIEAATQEQIMLMATTH